MTDIIIAVAIVGAVGLAAGILLALISHFFGVEKGKTLVEISACLPGVNCGACGYRGCDDYASALAKGEAKPNLCVPGAETTARKLGELLGIEVEAPKDVVAFVHCNGHCEATTNKAVYQFFGGETSDYWLDNFSVANSRSVMNYRMGHLKSDLLGINLIAPMMFAYSTYTQNEAALNNAIHLQESIVAENNKYTKPWSMAGFEMRNAFESQALIQLSKEYCSRLRCEECPLSQQLLK